MELINDRSRAKGAKVHALNTFIYVRLRDRGIKAALDYIEVSPMKFRVITSAQIHQSFLEGQTLHNQVTHHCRPFTGGPQRHRHCDCSSALRYTLVPGCNEKERHYY